jgi:hypothetical protein
MLSYYCKSPKKNGYKTPGRVPYNLRTEVAIHTYIPPVGTFEASTTKHYELRTHKCIATLMIFEGDRLLMYLNNAD